MRSTVFINISYLLYYRLTFIDRYPIERLRFEWMSYKDEQVGLTLSNLPMAIFTLTNSSIHDCTAAYFTGKLYIVSNNTCLTRSWLGVIEFWLSWPRLQLLTNVTCFTEAWCRRCASMKWITRSSVIIYVYAVECCYNAVQYNAIFHRALRWLKQNINQGVKSQNTPYISRRVMRCIVWGHNTKLTEL